MFCYKEAGWSIHKNKIILKRILLYIPFLEILVRVSLINDNHRINSFGSHFPCGDSNEFQSWIVVNSSWIIIFFYLFGSSAFAHWKGFQFCFPKSSPWRCVSSGEAFGPIFKVFSMTRPGIEPEPPSLRANTLPMCHWDWCKIDRW